MAVTLQTTYFLNLLKVAGVTSSKKPDDPALASAYIMSLPGGAEGHRLVATTSDGINHGQFTAEADGTFDEPFLLELGTSKWVVSMMNSALKKMRKLAGKDATYTVELRLEQARNGGQAMRVQTKTDGEIGEFDNTGVIGVRDASEFMTWEIYQDLRGVVEPNMPAPDGTPLKQGVMVPWPASSLKVLSQIAGIIGEPVYTYPLGHVANRKLVVCGENWRGSVSGADYPNPGDDSPIDLGEPWVELVDIRPADQRGEGETSAPIMGENTTANTTDNAHEVGEENKS